MLDEDKLLALTHQQPSGKRQVFSMFTENALECLSAMEKACANDDNELWMMATGQLSTLADVIGAAEFAGTVGDASDLDTQALDKRQNIVKIRAEFERLRAFLRSND